MQKFRDLLTRVLYVISLAALGVMTLHIVINALARSVFSSPLSGAFELVSYWELPVVTLLGFLAMHLRQEEISVSVLVERFSPGVRRSFEALAYATTFLISLGFAWFGFERALENMEIKLTGGAIEMPIWQITFLVPLVFSLLAVLCVMDFIETVRGTADPVSDESRGDDPAEQFNPVV